MAESLLDVMCRWARQGHTDNMETPLDAYGKRVLNEVIRVLPRTALETVTADLNHHHLRRLIELMWQAIGHSSEEFDAYATALFERPIRGSWRVFVHMAKQGVPHDGPGEEWYWDNFREIPHYPASEIITFEFFVSVYLHEVAHGWCYLMTDTVAVSQWLESINYNVKQVGTRENWRKDEETLCWEISRFVCKLLNVEFDEAGPPPQIKDPTTT